MKQIIKQIFSQHATPNSAPYSTSATHSASAPHLASAPHSTSHFALRSTLLWIRKISIGVFASVFLFLVSCTSTIGQQTIQTELSNNADILLFTLFASKNSFLKEDVDFEIDEANKRIMLSLGADDIKAGESIRAKTRFAVDLAIPDGASIVINGEIIREETSLELFLAKGFFEGRELPLVVIAENQTNQRRYTISSTFQKPSFSFRYSKRGYFVKTEQDIVLINKPTIRGSANGDTRFSISPVDSYTTLAANGSLTLTPDKNLTEPLVRNYVVRGRRQGIRFSRRVRVTFYPNQKPSVPILTTPENYEREIDRTQAVTLSWTPSEDLDGDALTYQVLVSSNGNLFSETSLSELYQQDDVDGEEDFAINSTTTRTSYVISDHQLAPDTLYYWRVVTSDKYAESESAVFRFTTTANQLPSAFSLLTPTSKAMLNLKETKTSTFEWETSEDEDNDAIRYVFYLSSDLFALRKTIRDSILNQTALKQKNIFQVIEQTSNTRKISHKNLAPRTTYYWTVKATDSFSEEIAEIYEFTTSDTENTLMTLSPPNNSDRLNGGNPFNLEWSFPEIAETAETPQETTETPQETVATPQFTVFFSDNEREVALEDKNAKIASNLTTNLLNITNKLDSRTTYYWKVNGKTAPSKTGEGKTASLLFASPLSSFTTTNHTPSRPTLVYPNNAATAIPRINGVFLAWNESVDLDRDDILYNIYLASDEERLLVSEQEVKIASSLTELSYVIPPENLEPLTVYYWKVGATDGHAENFSPVYSFATGTNIAPKAPELLQPLALGEDNRPSPELGYSNGISFIWGLPTYIEGDEIYKVLIDTNIDNLTEEAALIKSPEIKRYRFVANQSQILLKTKFFWKLLIKDRYGLTTESKVESFQTKGFSFRVNRQVITARNPNDFSFSLRIEGGTFSKNQFSYRYTLSDTHEISSHVTGEGAISTERTVQPLAINTLGAGPLTLKVDIVQELDGQVMESFKRVVSQEGFIKVANNNTLSQIGRTPRFPLSATYTLMNDLDLESSIFQPIGNDSAPFTGIFYGQNLTISNLTISRIKQESSGFFGNIRDGFVSELNIVTSKAGITGGDFTGGLSGKITGNSTITNISFNGSVKGTDQVGGIAGRINGTTTVRNVTSRGRINGNDNIGGIGGRVYSGVKVINSKSFARVVGNDDVGGIIGRGIDISISNVTTENAIEGRNNIGGIAGSLVQSEVTGSSSQSQINGRRKIGGIAGWLSGSGVANSFSISEITGLLEVGGIVGYALSESKIRDTYSESRLRGRNNVGGIVGLIAGKSSILNSYVRGIIIPNTQQQGSDAEEQHFGGVTGKINGSNILNHNFYSFVSIAPLKKASLVLTEERTPANSSGIKGLNPPSLKRASTFQNWDFRDIWELNSTVNNGFPFLKQVKPN